MKSGTFVFILEEVPSFKNGKNTVIVRKIPGKVEHVDGEEVIVLHYGPAHHFCKNHHRYGLYRTRVAVGDLEEREANLEDPMELL